MLLLIAGGATIVYNANTKQDEYTVEQAITILKQPTTICTIIFSTAFLIGTLCYLSYFTRQLRNFEKEVDAYDARSETTDDSRALLPLRGNIRTSGDCEAVEKTNELLIDKESSVSEVVQRSACQLITSLHNLSEEQLIQVSGDSGSSSSLLRLKKSVKVPMVLCIASSALMSGVSMIFLKLLTELIAVDRFWDRPIMAFILIACTIGSGFFQIHMLNNAMKMYD